LQNFSLGILTGRTEREARVALGILGWDDIISKEKIVTADDGVGKPHPRGLKKITNSLKTKLGIYKEVKTTKFLSAIVLGEGFDLRSKSAKFYLDEEVDLLAQDVNSILYYLERVKNNL
jgi:hypothetical protein